MEEQQTQQSISDLLHQTSQLSFFLNSFNTLRIKNHIYTYTPTHVCIYVILLKWTHTTSTSYSQ